jgi:hypothetical protein
MDELPDYKVCSQPSPTQLAAVHSMGSTKTRFLNGIEPLACIRNASTHPETPGKHFCANLNFGGKLPPYLTTSLTILMRNMFGLASAKGRPGQPLYPKFWAVIFPWELFFYNYCVRLSVLYTLDIFMHILCYLTICLLSCISTDYYFKLVLITILNL